MRNPAVIVLLACAVAAHAASYTTYIGDANQYQVSAIATDTSGNTYITGSRVIEPESAATYYLPVTDVFVGKLDSAGNRTLIGTFSGKGIDQANGIAVDPSGNIYIAGNTTSPDFPLRNPLQSIAYTAGTGFLMKLSPDGTILYSTYLGGSLASSWLNSVAADSNGNAYVTGTTQAPDYQHTAGLPAGTVGGGSFFISGAFFAKVDPAGDRVLYAGTLAATNSACGTSDTCLLSPLPTNGASIAVDQAGDAYIAGNTGGTGLPATPGALLTEGIGAFIAKVNPAGTALVYLTYLGAANYVSQPIAFGSDPGNSVYAVAADADGNAYISGETSDPAFPATASAFQPALLGANAFVAKLNPTGSAMVWATFLGGTSNDAAQTVATDSSGDIWVSGTTQSTDFPTTVSVTPKGGEFLARFNSTGSALSYSATFPINTVAQALAVDSSGTVHVAGATGLISAFAEGSAPGQTSAPWMFGIANAAGGILSGRLAPAELISIYGLHLGPVAPVSATFDAAGFLPTTLGGVQVAINGIPAPLLYVSEMQINAVAPLELTAGSSVELRLLLNSAPLLDLRMMVDIAAPGVFVNADGSAAAINQDGTVNSKANPAPVGSYISVWATGTGYYPGSDGQMAAGANEFCDGALLYCPIFQGDGTQVNVSYSGAAPGMVTGVIQINFQVTASQSYQSYYLSVNGINSGFFGVYTTP